MSLSQIIFDDYSTDGKMSAAQFSKMCFAKNYEGIDEAELDAAFVRLDANGDGSLEYQEFLDWWKLQDNRQEELHYQNPEEKKRITKARGSFLECTKGATSMSPEQFRLKCYANGYCLSDEELEEAFAELDKDQSGEIEFAEYLRWRNMDDRFAHCQQLGNEHASYIRQVAEFFRQYDADLKGYLSVAQFSELYQGMVDAGDVTEVSMPLDTVLKELDVAGSGVVKLNDFVKWYSASAEEYVQAEDEDEQEE